MKSTHEDSLTSNINVLIPMAGLGKRFMDAGFTTPKPFIGLGEKPMIAHVLENLKIPNARYIVIAQKDHLSECPEIVGMLRTEFDLTFVEIDSLTEGAACTCLFARRLIDNDSPLLIANCDQLIDIPITKFLADAQTRNLDGSILTFKSNHPKWSYAKIDSSGYITEVREKEVISDHATVGIYLFNSGRDFVGGAIDMIIANRRVNNEFYVCPIFNELIAGGKRYGIYPILESQMHGIGTPEDLKIFLARL